MAKELVFIGTYAIPEGKFHEWKTAIKEMTDFVKANVPRLISFNTYVNQRGTEATTIYVHPDSESLEQHLEVAGSRIRTGVQTVQTRRVELYGNPSDRLVDRMRRLSEMSGSWPVIVKAHWYGFCQPADIPS